LEHLEQEIEKMLSDASAKDAQEDKAFALINAAMKCLKI